MPSVLHRRLAIVLAVLFGPVAGCANLPTMPWQKLPLDAEAGLYKSAAVDYQVDAGLLNLPVAVARVEGQRLCFEQFASQPRAGSAVGKLSIRYPHPEGKPGLARVELAVTNDPRPQRPWWQPTHWLPTSASKGPTAASSELWLLDIPKADLDQILAEMPPRWLLRLDATPRHQRKPQRGLQRPSHS